MQTELVDCPTQTQSFTAEKQFFLLVPLSLLACDISTNNVLLLSKIHYMAKNNKKYNTCFASCERLGEWLGLTKTAVSHNLSILEEQGYIKKGWINNNLTKKPYYLSTKHKYPTPKTLQITSECHKYLKIPQHIAESQNLNATNKLVYASCAYLRKPLPVEISELLGIKYHTVCSSLRKLKNTGLINAENRIIINNSAALADISTPHRAKPRGITHKTYTPSLPFTYRQRQDADSGFLFLPFVEESAQIKIKKPYIEPHEEAVIKKMPHKKILTFEEAMGSFIIGNPAEGILQTGLNGMEMQTITKRLGVKAPAIYAKAINGVLNSGNDITEEFWQKAAEVFGRAFAKEFPANRQEEVLINIENHIVAQTLEEELCKQKYNGVMKVVIGQLIKIAHNFPIHDNVYYVNKKEYTMKPLKIAYIGTSPITVECLEASKACPNEIQPYAVLSRSAEKGEEFVKKYQLSKVFSSVEDLAKNGKEIEGVYIASPNALHHSQAKTLLEAGKHLLIEKPFTVTLNQAQELTALAEAKGLVLLEAVIPAHCPNFKSLIAHMPKLGKILGAKFSFGKLSSKWDAFQRGEQPNIFSPEMGGGSLMDIGVYGVWMMAALFGKPQSFIHEVQMLSTGVDGKGILRCAYPSFEAEVVHSKISEEGNFFEIQGENGVLRAEYFSKIGGASFTPKGGAAQDISVLQDPRAMVYELKSFAGLVRNTAPIPPYCSTKTTLIAMEILTQARRSSGIIFPEDTKEGPSF